MNKYKAFNINELFMNKKLSHVFPQFSRRERAQGEILPDNTEERARKYVVAALNGKIAADGTIYIKGKHDAVLKRVRRLQATLENFLQSTPYILKAMRNNAKVMLPYATLKQIEDTRSSAMKINAMQEILDNIQYNSDCNALNSVKNESTTKFSINKTAWELKVGYRRLKKI